MRSLYIQHFFHSSKHEHLNDGRNDQIYLKKKSPSLQFCQEVFEKRDQSYLNNANGFQQIYGPETTNNDLKIKVGQEPPSDRLRDNETLITSPPLPQEQKLNVWDVSKRLDPKKVFISFKDKSLHERMLANIFQRFGKVRNSFLGKTSTNKSQVCFGFIKFYDCKAASKAIACGRLVTKTGSEILIKAGLKKGSSKLKKKFMQEGGDELKQDHLDSQDLNHPNIGFGNRNNKKIAFNSSLELTCSLSSKIEERHAALATVDGLRFNIATYTEK